MRLRALKKSAFRGARALRPHYAKVYVKSGDGKSCDFHTKSAWYLYTFKEHYRTHICALKSTKAHTDKLLTHGNIVVKAAEDLEQAMEGMANPQNNANIADLQGLAEITKQMTERKKLRAVNEAPVLEMEEHKQLHNDTWRQIRFMSAHKIVVPRRAPTTRIAPNKGHQRVQPRAPIPAQIVYEPPPPKVDETPTLRVGEASALRVQRAKASRARDTLKKKRSQQKEEPATKEPIASRTRSQQKGGPTGPAYGTCSKSRGATALAMALAAATNCAGVDCSPRQLVSRRFPSANFETAIAVMDGKTGEMLKYQQLINHPDPKVVTEWVLLSASEFGRLF